MTTRMVLNPKSIDVVVATNLHADVLSDLAAALTGSLGIAPTANLNPERAYPSMFEPIHGSAFDIMGKGIANPVGALWSASMMLQHLGEPRRPKPDGRHRALYGIGRNPPPRPRRHRHYRRGEGRHHRPDRGAQRMTASDWQNSHHPLRPPRLPTGGTLCGAPYRRCPFPDMGPGRPQGAHRRGRRAGHLRLLGQSLVRGDTGKLHFIQVCAAGYDGFDQGALKARGIRLANASGVNVNAVSEHAMAPVPLVSRASLAKPATTRGRRCGAA